ncbi:MAG: flavodoxin, partial [Campylobacteraceae bacterium]
GLGDLEGFGSYFCNAIGTLYDLFVEKGAKVVGNNVETDSYNFDESTAVVNGKFVGLAIDEDNQSDLTSERIDSWINSIKDNF